MPEIVPFDYNHWTVRTIEREGQPWFIAADVCAVLEIVDIHRAMSRLDEDDRRQAPVVDAVGRQNPNTWVVNESGLYQLIFQSRKPEARAFKRWITSEVIPSIRKTGRYEVQPRDQLDVLAEQVAALQRVRDEASRAQTTAEQAHDTARESQARLDSMEGQRHPSALAYCKYTGRATDTKSLQRLGRMASTVGTRDGLKPGSTDDNRFGVVNTWPYPVWDEAALRVDALGGGPQ